ncbi:DHA2 family multidrug resistance protein-like MFS transporter [Oceanisphaera litoralis]|uniref:MFS transporter n=1 Tax=Oceanisphaera litoralis TaxID=225144 RepID=UPI0019570301|nr:MFS transporter [Oceanisphaera litoralis]MBM7455880.1 DHA2 family multidrug resistance protein-like MFS transporter [Oceanisphaera litoralis]
MNQSAAAEVTYQGNDRLLFGIIMGLLAFWLFAQTTLNIAPTMAADLGVEQSLMNIAVSITALFSGIFVVVVGGLADRIGRVKTVMWGFAFSITGSLLLGFAPSGDWGSSFLLLGRICQGLSGAFIMPASLALVKEYWQGAGRQRAISLWSMGTWGGTGFAALFGGLMAENVGWRWIFIVAALVSLLGMLMVRGTPESRARVTGGSRFDVKGIMVFVTTMVALQVLATQGSKFGWTSPMALGLMALVVGLGVTFFKLEFGNPNAFVQFRLFRNRIYTGAALSNLLLNATAGIIIVTMLVLQQGGGLSAQAAGLVTLGYAISILAFIRVGEKLLQRFGPRQPMLWGCCIVGLTIVLLMQTHLMLESYKLLSVIAFTLFGVGLAFYATPSTDAALSNLPSEQAGAGAGIYKMASSLGSSFGVAIASAVYTAIASDNAGVNWIEGVVTFVGNQENLASREAAFFALLFTLVLLVTATVSIVLTIPKGKVAERG